MALDELLTSQRKMRAEFVVLNGSTITTSLASTGVDEGTYVVTAKKDGSTAGLYTINITNPFSRSPCVIPAALDDASGSTLVATLVSVSTSEIVIRVESDAGTATAADKLHVMIVGSDSADGQRA